jgi:hypothetical protein
MRMDADEGKKDAMTAEGLAARIESLRLPGWMLVDGPIA